MILVCLFLFVFIVIVFVYCLVLFVVGWGVWRFALQAKRGR
jgi:hypothetical protein